MADSASAAEKNLRADAVVDITDVCCPVTFVKAKAAMEELAVGQILEVRLNAGEALENVPRSFKDEGQRLLRVGGGQGGVYSIFVKKLEG